MAIIQVQPSDVLDFDRSLIQTKHLVLKNPSSIYRVSFRLKTAMPSMVITSPTMGILGKNESVNVRIYMNQDGQETDEETDEETIQMRHKVFVQATIVYGNVIDLQKFWLELRPIDIWDYSIEIKIAMEKSKSKLMDRLLKQVQKQNKEMDTLIKKGNLFVNCFLFFLTFLIVLLAFILAIVYRISQ